SDKIKATVEKVSQLRGQIQAADALWSKANESRPSFGQMRAEGVREGRARASIVDLNRQLRELTSGTKEADGLQEFQKEFEQRRSDFLEYSDRLQQQMAWRQQMAERIQGGVEPQIQAARTAA